MTTQEDSTPRDVATQAHSGRELRRFDVCGDAITFEHNGEQWWATAEEIAAPLGYVNGRNVLKLFKRHEQHFDETESVIDTLSTTDGKAYAKRVFSPRGMLHLCILGRTEQSRKAHKRILDIDEELRHGGKLLSADQVGQLATELKQLRSEYQHLATQLDQRVAAIEARPAQPTPTLQPQPQPQSRPRRRPVDANEYGVRMFRHRHFSIVIQQIYAEEPSQFAMTKRLAEDADLGETQAFRIITGRSTTSETTLENLQDLYPENFMALSNAWEKDVLGGRA